MNPFQFERETWRRTMAALVFNLATWVGAVNRVDAATLVETVQPSSPASPMVVVDYDRDRRLDAVIVRQGGIWLRRDVVQPESTWTLLPFEIPAGFDADTLEAGDLNGDAAPDLVVTSATAQRALVFMGPSSSATGAAARVVEVPGGVQAVEWLTPSKALLLALATLRPYVTQIPGDGGSVAGAPARPSAASESPVSASRFGISIDGYQAAGVLDLVAGPLGTAGAPLLGLLWQSSNAAPSQILFGELDQGAVRKPRVLRRKWPDIILKRGYSRLELGFSTETREAPILVAWRPGGSELTTVMLRPDGTMQVTEVLSGALGIVIGDVRRVAGDSGDEWLIRDASGTRVVIYRAGFDGRFLVARDLVAPGGERFESVFGLADGGVVATVARAGGTGKTLAAEWLGVYQNQNGKLEPVSRGELPSSAKLVSRASVLVYERDPFLDPTARELEVLTAGVWTREAVLVAGGVSVTTETFKSDRTGLGLVEVREIKTAQTLSAKAYVMANQWKPDTSVFFGMPSRGPGTQDPTVVDGAGTDSDRDGMGDIWERWCFGGLEVGPGEDRDGDGFGALAEYKNATDPNDARSKPSVEDQELTVVRLTVAAGGRVSLRWKGPASSAYVVESSDDLVAWGVAAGQVVGAGDEWEWQEEAGAGKTRFYRVKQTGAP